MRYLCLLLAVLPSTGCSGFVAARGVELGDLETRKQVRGVFGTPTTSGDDGDTSYDEYFTRRKLAERWKGTGICMGFVMTLGLSEFYLFPRELICAARQRIEGNTVRFVYDADGNVIAVSGFYSAWKRLPGPGQGGTPKGDPPP